MRCPTCEALLDPRWICANGHAFPLRDGVPSIIGDDLRTRLVPFLDAFSAYRVKNGARIEDPAVFASIPESGRSIDPSLWTPRALDLRLVQRMIGDRKNLRILDVGAWNGWLSHRLASAGHRVLALDYFTDPFDGIGAVRHYPVKFEAIQFDLERLDLVDERFDLVIMNRCAAYFEDLGRSLQQLRELLLPHGTMLMTGLNIFRDTASIEAHFNAARQRFTKEYGMPYFFKPIKGYQTEDDVRVLRDHGVAVRSYPALRWKNTLSFLRPGKPRYFFGVLSV